MHSGDHFYLCNFNRGIKRTWGKNDLLHFWITFYTSMASCDKNLKISQCWPLEWSLCLENLKSWNPPAHVPLWPLFLLPVLRGQDCPGRFKNGCFLLPTAFTWILGIYDATSHHTGVWRVGLVEPNLSNTSKSKELKDDARHNAAVLRAPASPSLQV